MYFVFKFVLNYCEKTLFSWSIKAFWDLYMINLYKQWKDKTIFKRNAFLTYSWMFLSSKLKPKMQQTKLLVTRERFGGLFLFGLIWHTEKKTEAWWDIFMTWKIDFGLLAVAWAGLWNKMFGPIMSNFWGRFFQLFLGKNFFFQKNQFFLGLKIWVYILRPSDQPSVSFYCGGTCPILKSGQVFYQLSHL